MGRHPPRRPSTNHMKAAVPKSSLIAAGSGSYRGALEIVEDLVGKRFVEGLR